MDMVLLMILFPFLPKQLPFKNNHYYYLSVSGPEGIGNPNHHRIPMEEEVVFRLLCQFDKVGSLIGKGGSIRRAIQSETGASIKIADSAPESDDRVVVISAREACEN